MIENEVVITEEEDEVIKEMSASDVVKTDTLLENAHLRAPKITEVDTVVIEEVEIVIVEEEVTHQVTATIVVKLDTLQEIVPKLIKEKEPLKDNLIEAQ